MPAALTEIEADLLLAFETAPSLEKLARACGRDATVVSRQLSRIAGKGDFLLKVSGRWTLSDLGKRYNDLTRDHRFRRDALFAKRRSLRIGAGREFLARVVAERFDAFRSAVPGAELSLVACEGGVELALLAGEIDLGLDCGRPESPEIQYAQEATESILAVATPAFWKQHSTDGLSRAPHIHCERLKADRISGGKLSAARIAIRTNDLATARALCLKGVGWALLPAYTISEALSKKSLVAVTTADYGERYGVWRLRARDGIRADFEHVRAWLREVKL